MAKLLMMPLVQVATASVFSYIEAIPKEKMATTLWYRRVDIALLGRDSELLEQGLQGTVETLPIVGKWDIGSRRKTGGSKRI